MPSGLYLFNPFLRTKSCGIHTNNMCTIIEKYRKFDNVNSPSHFWHLWQSSDCWVWPPPCRTHRLALWCRTRRDSRMWSRIGEWRGRRGERYMALPVTLAGKHSSLSPSLHLLLPCTSSPLSTNKLRGLANNDNS